MNCLEERERQIPENLSHPPFTQNRKQVLKGRGELPARARIVIILQASVEIIPDTARPARSSLAFENNQMSEYSHYPY